MKLNDKKKSDIPILSDEKYTGMYLSDGKFQSSVVFGKTAPNSQLDALSRLHDTAYAYYPDKAHRRVADRLYKEAANKLGDKFADLAGEAVTKGNSFLGGASNLAMASTAGSIFGSIGSLVTNTAKNIFSLNDQLQNEDKYEKDILNLFSTDPFKGNDEYYYDGMYSQKETQGQRLDRLAASSKLPGISEIPVSMEPPQRLQTHELPSEEPVYDPGEDDTAKNVLFNARLANTVARTEQYYATDVSSRSVFRDMPTDETPGIQYHAQHPISQERMGSDYVRTGFYNTHSGISQARHYLFNKNKINRRRRRKIYAA